jgi:hypothetical protein
MIEANTEQTSGRDWPLPISGESSSRAALSFWEDAVESESNLWANYEQQMTKFAAEQRRQVERLSKNYVFDDGERVRSFLQNHRALSEILLEAAPELRRCFGDEIMLQLQVPCEEGLPGVIYGIVIWKGDVRTARVALQQFDDSWWMAATKKASGRIVFDYQLA